MSTAIGKFLGSILRSLFVSVAMLVIALSFITGSFPPDLGKLRGTQAKIPEGHVLVKEEELRRLQSELGTRQGLGEKISPHAPPAATPVPRVDLESKVRELRQDVFRLQERLHRLEDRMPEGTR